MICGGKGYHLAQLQRYDFPVPDGGVIVADVYGQLMQAPALTALRQTLTTLCAEDVMDPIVQEQLALVRQGITAAVLPAQVCTERENFLRQSHLDDRAVAVRSSAVSEDSPSASFAGMHQSVLNVRGIDAICGAILQCFASLWTPQAVAYRRRMAFGEDDVLCAVVLCAMVTTPDGTEPRGAGIPHRRPGTSGSRCP